MNFLPLLEAKREDRPLAPEQIQEFIREFMPEKPARIKPVAEFRFEAMLKT